MIDNAVAQLPGRTQFEAKGRLQLSGQRAFRGEMLVASNQPSGLAAWLAGSVDPAIRKLKTAGFSATVNLTDTLQQFERLEVAAGPAVLRGRIERQAIDGVPPNLSLQLKGNRIDLEALQALAGLGGGRRLERQRCFRTRSPPIFRPTSSPLSARTPATCNWWRP